MVNYSCPRCVKVFAQKSHYKSHLNRKNPCQNNADKIKKLVEEEVTKKFQELKLINSKQDFFEFSSNQKKLDLLNITVKKPT